jgi:hypothetical protein
MPSHASALPLVMAHCPHGQLDGQFLGSVDAFCSIASLHHCHHAVRAWVHALPSLAMFAAHWAVVVASIVCMLLLTLLTGAPDQCDRHLVLSSEWCGALVLWIEAW